MFINRVSSYVYLPPFMPRHNVAPRLPCATRAAQVKEKVTLELKEVILEQLEGAYDEVLFVDADLIFAKHADELFSALEPHAPPAPPTAASPRRVRRRPDWWQHVDGGIDLARSGVGRQAVSS